MPNWKDYFLSTIVKVARRRMSEYENNAGQLDKTLLVTGRATWVNKDYERRELVVFETESEETMRFEVGRRYLITAEKLD